MSRCASESPLPARTLGRALSRCCWPNVLLALVVTLTYFGLSALLSPFFSRRDAPMAYLLATILISLTIVPVRRRVRAVINRLIYDGWQSGEELLRDIGGALSRTIDPDALRTLLVDDLPGAC